MGIFTRLKALGARHKKSILIALVLEIFVKFYQKKLFRKVTAPFFNKTREPIGWVFVGGCYNSGTTLVKNIILLHHSVSGMPIEGDQFSDALADFETGGWARCMYGNKNLIDQSRVDSVLDLSLIHI